MGAKLRPDKRGATYRSTRRVDFMPGRLRRVLAFIVGLLLLLAVLTGIGFLVLSHSSLPFRQISVTSDDKHVAVDAIQRVVSKSVKAGFFALNSTKLRAQISLLPWVDYVSIRRIWPDRLRVQIHERKAAATWNENQLVTKDGVLFQPDLATFPPGLVRLAGPMARERDVLIAYQQLQQAFGRYHLKIKSLTLQRHSWRLQFATNALLFMSENELPDQLLRFHKLYKRLLHDRMQQVEQIDLRYAGGAAVQWRSRT